MVGSTSINLFDKASRKPLKSFSAARYRFSSSTRK
jgi:hypothetical protein